MQLVHLLWIEVERSGRLPYNKVQTFQHFKFTLSGYISGCCPGSIQVTSHCVDHHDLLTLTVLNLNQVKVGSLRQVHGRHAVKTFLSPWYMITSYSLISLELIKKEISHSFTFRFKINYSCVFVIDDKGGNSEIRVSE